MTGSATVRALVLADTHLGPGQAQRLIERLPRALTRADAILHAGDVTDLGVLDALSAHAPVHAVLGNNDRGVVLPERLPERLIVRLGGCEVAMVHDSGPSAGRATRLRRWFPDADVVVFGHSHIPWHQTHVLEQSGHVQHHLNPGSAMQHRQQPRCTVAWLELGDGRVVDVRHIAVPSSDA